MNHKRMYMKKFFKKYMQVAFRLINNNSLKIAKNCHFKLFVLE